jgi:hypothetical protein
MFTKVIVLAADHKDVGNQAHDVSQLLQLSFFYTSFGTNRGPFALLLFFHL